MEALDFSIEAAGRCLLWFFYFKVRVRRQLPRQLMLVFGPVRFAEKTSSNTVPTDLL